MWFRLVRWLNGVEMWTEGRADGLRAQNAFLFVCMQIYLQERLVICFKTDVF